MENQQVNEESKVEEKADVKDTTEPKQENVTPIKEEIDWKAKYFYMAAEFENFKKREQRERESLIKFGNERMIQDLLDVVDNFERTIEMLKPDQDAKVKNIVFGIDMVKKQFLDVLTKSGLTEIKTEGVEFDPNFHEAISQGEKEGVKSNFIISVQQKGYMLNGRLTRAAKVTVAK